MPYKQLAYSKYNSTKKKLPGALRVELGHQEDVVAENPMQGEAKKGDLQGIWVRKFRFLQEEYLLAYEIDKQQKAVIFLAIGGHENFYRELKRYLKS
ncbi:MAG: hypothetical protein A2Z21_04250 [Candidatus Fraserbacteria bacterium RBG_16_55_9]|uniref:Addiction module toxin RelE n=1 Tax=Fraserbacteria sp. (strain RBG_16_55_9) TaxID=1817864 RepID=A0A1F5UP03_FRAXR|nr:MAG: hypothetical protein A2Z21_04250 [Candidatus Fraserbacteria bacterium RBG_16_55_9]